MGIMMPSHVAQCILCSDPSLWFLAAKLFFSIHRL